MVFFEPWRNLASLREWMMQGGDIHAPFEGLPLWLPAMQHASVDVVATLVEEGAMMHERLADERGWLHIALDTGQPAWLIQQGLAKLGTDWWHPDWEGRTPLHCANMGAAEAGLLGWRGWRDRCSWRALGNSPITLHEAEGRLEVARTLAHWKPLWRP